MRRPLALLACLLLAGAAGAFLVANTKSGSTFVFEAVPAGRRPIDILVDTEPLSGVDVLGVTQDLMDRWNAIPEAEDVFGIAMPGGPYNGATVGSTFGVFTNTQYEVALDGTGQVLSHFGIGTGVLGITLKTVDEGTGQLFDFLIVVNTAPGALTFPGATTEELFRSTLLHELGHAVGLGHTPVGMSNTTLMSFGLLQAQPAEIPTMYPFRLPGAPQEGGTLERDDTAALATVYPAGTAGLGSISGTVRSLSGVPVNEIAVRAVGTAGHVGRLTDTDGTGNGTFTIPGLPPGAYRVVIEAVNGRGGVSAAELEGTPGSLGANAFVYAADEFWQPGDTYDPSVDGTGSFAFVQVRAGSDTGSVDFILNAASMVRDQVRAGTLVDPDSRLAVGSQLHLVDYFVFRGNAGENATITAISPQFTPQLRLLDPLDFSTVDEATPGSGTATLSTTLPRTGIYTIAMYTRGTGGGSYTLTLQGTGGTLPPAPTVTGAAAALGPANPAVRQTGSPTCETAVLQLRLTAPSHEELWVDRIRVRTQGSGHDALDIADVGLVHDLDGDGTADPGEPVLATGNFGANDGVLAFDDLGLEVDAGDAADLLVTLEVAVQSVSSAGFPWWGFLPLVLALAWIRPRRVLRMLLLCALVPLSCGGGGGGGGGCAPVPFDPGGAVVTFQLQIDAGEILAYTSTSTTALNLPVANLTSAVLSVSN